MQVHKVRMVPKLAQQEWSSKIRIKERWEGWN